MRRERQRFLRLAPDSLTVLRPVLGALCAFALVRDEAGTAGWLYLAAYLTDVLDGLLARALGVSSQSGTRLDGWADLTTSVLISIGIAVRSVADAAWWVLVAITAMVGLGLIRNRWIAVHTVIGKAVGGAYRIAVFILILALTSWQERPELVAAGAVIFTVTYIYEARVTLAEGRTGERPLR
jgi:cardiolipin synthase